MSNSILMNGILENQGFQNKEEIDSLVKLLARSSILPKLGHINIVASEKQPDLFYINPGVSINIGTSFLKNPTISLLILRYGIEWQIWFEACGKDKRLTQMCDLAALKVTAQFYSMLPPLDRESFGNNHPLIIKLIEENIKEPLDVFNLEPDILQMLNAVHSKDYSKKRLSKKWVSIIENLAKPTEIMLMDGGRCAFEYRRASIAK